MDISQMLKDTENALRDFIGNLLNEKLGEEWLKLCGVTEERLQQWQQRMNIDKLTTDKRLIYYSDFFDLQVIIRKQWNVVFKEIFDDLKTIEVFLSILEGFRNTDAHRRELLPYQTQLIEGICGEIRAALVKYRSKKETGEDCFSRLEFAQDNYGNTWKIGDHRGIDTKMTLRPGDILEFVVTASDPDGGKLEYRIAPRGDWQENNKFSITLGEKHISKSSSFTILVRSKRQYYADQLLEADDSVHFTYQILPLKN